MASQHPVIPPARPLPPGVKRAPLGSGPRHGSANGKQRPPPRRGGLLATIGYLVLLVLAAGGSAIGYFVLNPPSDLIRQRVAAQVRERTGRELLISGPASLTLFPTLGVSLADVALSSPEGMAGKLVRMQSLDVSVKALTL